MAVQFYVEEADRSAHSGLANEKLAPGTLVTDDGSGVRKVQFADGDYDGLALHDPEYLSAPEEDEVAPTQYDVDQRVRYHPQEDAARVRVRTLEDSGGPAPSISHRSVVGIVDETDADAPSGVVGRVVEEGYQADASGDGASTTFSRANNNFLAIGIAQRPGQQNGDTVTAYDDPVRVLLFSEAQA